MRTASRAAPISIACPKQGQRQKTQIRKNPTLARRVSKYAPLKSEMGGNFFPRPPNSSLRFRSAIALSSERCEIVQHFGVQGRNITPEDRP
jgi:hypothetical protein